MKSAADTVKETSRKLMDYHLGTGRLPDWNDLFQGFSAAQELLAASNAQPKLLRVQRAWFKDQQSGKTVEIVISSDAPVDWLGVNELLIRGCSKPWARVTEEVARNMLTEESKGVMTEDRNPGMKHFDALPIEQKLAEAAEYWENHFRGYSAMPSYVACFREGATEIKRLKDELQIATDLGQALLHGGSLMDGINQNLKRG